MAVAFPRDRALRLYYLATPLFVLLDFGFGLNLRLAGLEGHPGVRVAWYGACVACALLTWRAPVLAPLVALIESAATVLALVLGVMLPYFDLVARVAADDLPAASAGGSLAEGVANLLLSGPALVVALLRRPTSAN